MRARRLELAQQPVDVVGVVVRPLAVLRLGVVAGAAREERRPELPGQRAVRDAVAVDVLVAAPLADRLQRLRRQHLAAVERRLGIRERLGHPVVHAEVEIGHHEDRRLEALGEVEGLDGHRVALGDRRRQQQDVLGVAVRQARGKGDVALRGARRQARRGADTLDVEDHRRQLGVVGQPRELRHQRDAGARGRRHRAGAGPRRADDHAERGDLVLGLHDRERRLAGLGIHAVLAQVVDQRLAQRRRRRDRVPRHDGDAGHQAAERGGRVALDQDQVAASRAIRSTASGTGRSAKCSLAYAKPACSAARFSASALAFFFSCRVSALSISASSMPSRRASTPS